MKAWYINLDRSLDRRAHMESILTKLGVEYERMPAVDGQLLSDEDVARVYKQAPNHHFLDRGSIGVFLSQRKVWQAIVDSGDTHGIVFEDDVLFGETANEIFADFSWVAQDTDLIRLETVFRYTVRDIKPISSIMGRDIVQLHDVLLGAGAYIISAKAANALLRQTAQFRYACDYVLFDPKCNDFCGLKVHQMVPAICVQSAVAKTGGLDSILNELRRQSFVRGPKRTMQKIMREVDKRKLIIMGLLTDRNRGRKTGKVGFR